MSATVHLVKSMVFPVVMYALESWAIKKAECWRIDDFKLWCWGEDSLESLKLQGDQTSQSWSKSTLNIHWKDWSWSWSSNTLATWWEEPTHWKKAWCWERLRVGGEGAIEDEMIGWHHQLNGHEFEQTPGDGDGWGGLACCDSWGHKESDMTAQLNWTELIPLGNSHYLVFEHLFRCMLNTSSVNCLLVLLAHFSIRVPFFPVDLLEFHI